MCSQQVRHDPRRLSERRAGDVNSRDTGGKATAEAAENPGFWSTILDYFFIGPVPERNHYKIKVYTFLLDLFLKGTARK